MARGRSGATALATGGSYEAEAILSAHLNLSMPAASVHRQPLVPLLLAWLPLAWRGWRSRRGLRGGSLPPPPTQRAPFGHVGSEGQVLVVLGVRHGHGFGLLQYSSGSPDSRSSERNGKVEF